jgi:microcystin-dependent protein
MKKIIQLQDLQPGTKYLVRARAKNQYDFFSEWSQTYELNIIKDDLKPSKPAKPVIEIAGPQKVVVSHDNTKDGGGNLEFDVTSYKVYTNTSSTNVGGTLIHTMSATRPGSGISSFATINVNAPLSEDDPQTLYFYVTAVDSAGNESDPSDATTGTPITYFDSAYISQLTADRIRTGTLQANQSISVGTVSPIIIKSNVNSPRGQIYIGTTSNPTGAVGSGYRDIQTAFYVDSTGKFSLKDKLYWDGNTLTIDGYFQIGDEETTISGNQIRTGNLISSNYESNVIGQPQAKSTGYTNAGTWIDLDDGEIYSKNFYLTNSGDAVFRGNIFGSRGIFNGKLPVSEIPGLQNPSGARVPTLIVESTNTDDGYLVFFKNAGTDSGLEFYVKQGAEENNVNWRRGSLAHLNDVAGGFLRLGAFPSSTGLTPGRIRIFAESSGNKQGEIYLDARRTFIQKIFLTQPSTTGDWATDPVTNFWKDPDGVSLGQDYFKVGSTVGSAITVRKRSDGTDKVIIKDYEIEGVTSIIDDSKITVNTVEIGKGVGGAGRHGIKIDNSNYWYDPAPLNSNDIVFRAGGSSSNALTVRKNGSVEFEGTTNPTGGEIKGKLIIKNVSDQLTFEIGRNVIAERDGIRLNSNNYWTISQTGLTANFRVGGNSKYLEWTGSSLNISTDSITIGGSPGATQEYASLVANNAVTTFSLVDKWNGTLSGVQISTLGGGLIRSIGKSSFGVGTGWILENNSNSPRFDIGSSSKYLRFDTATGKLVVSGEVAGGSNLGSSGNIVIDDTSVTSYTGLTIKSTVNSTPVAIEITPDLGGGQLLFVRGGSSDGALFSTFGSKFADSGFGAGVAIGNPVGYPFVEVGWTDTARTNSKISLYTQANVGLELRAANFILRGGGSSRIRGIPSSSTIPSGKQVLYGGENDNLEWAPAGGGSASSAPTGSIIMYGGSSAPSGWLLCNGQSYSASTSSPYYALFNVIGYSFGGSGSTFNVPNFISGGPGGTPAFPRGGNNIGNPGGQQSFTLTEANIPQHNHGRGTLEISGTSGGSGALSHSGSMDEKGGHTHTAVTGTISNQTSHSHGPGDLSTNNAGAHADTNTTYTFGSNTNTATVSGGANRLTSATSASSNVSIASHSHIVNAGSTNLAGAHGHTISFDWTSAAAGSHRHNILIDDHANHTHGAGTFSISGSTANWGTSSPSSVNNQPPFIVVNFIIKT